VKPIRGLNPHISTHYARGRLISRHLGTRKHQFGIARCCHDMKPASNKSNVSAAGFIDLSFSLGE
jgi:hypothetical protein